MLETAFYEIHTKNVSRLSFEELFRNAYRIVLKRGGEGLYEKVAAFEEQWLRNHVRPEITTLITPSIILGAAGDSLAGRAIDRRQAGERFLRALKDAFSDHQICMGMITDVLMYMVSSATCLLPVPSLDLLLAGQGELFGSTAPIDLRSCHDTLP